VGGGPGLVEVIAGVLFVYSTFSAVRDTLEIVEALRKWRDKALKKHAGTYVRIEREGHRPINIMTASDEELTLYIADTSDDAVTIYEPPVTIAPEDVMIAPDDMVYEPPDER
jgi:hypothetical protein